MSALSVNIYEMSAMGSYHSLGKFSRRQTEDHIFTFFPQEIGVGISCNLHDVKAYCLFVFVLMFYSPVNPMGSCRAQSVYLTTLFTEQS